MSGRSEHENRTNNNIENILKTSPISLKKYYLKIRTTKEPLTCLEYVRKINAFLEKTNKNINSITIEDIDDYMNMTQTENKESLQALIDNLFMQL